MIGFSLKDFRAEVIQKALNDATITTMAAASGVPGYREFGVSDMGVAVAKAWPCWCGWTIRRTWCSLLFQAPTLLMTRRVTGRSFGGHRCTK